MRLRLGLLIGHPPACISYDKTPDLFHSLKILYAVRIELRCLEIGHAVRDLFQLFCRTVHRQFATQCVANLEPVNQVWISKIELTDITKILDRVAITKIDL